MYHWIVMRNKMVTFSNLSRFYLCCILKDNSLLVLPAKILLIWKMDWRWMHLCANDVNDGFLATDEGTTGDRIALRRSWVPFLPGTLKIFWVVPRDVENLFARRPGSKLFFQTTWIFTVVWLEHFGRHLRAYNKSKSWLHPWLLYPFSSNISCMKQWRVYGSLYWNLKFPAIFVKGLRRTFLSSPIKMCYMHNVHTFTC